MAIDSAAPRTRRALLAAALGAGAATVASALGRPVPASAADGQTVVVGGEYTASSVTKIDTGATAAQAALWGVSGGIGVRGTGTASTGVMGDSTSGPGVYGVSSSGMGVEGTSDSKDGVSGWSTARVGVAGHSESTVAPGTLGESFGNSTGVLGYSGSDTHPAAPAKTGVLRLRRPGLEQSRGDGLLPSGSGHQRHLNDRHRRLSSRHPHPMVGTSLRAVGKVKFDKSAGIATIASGASSGVVTPGIDLTATSAVVATLQGTAAARRRSTAASSTPRPTRSPSI